MINGAAFLSIEEKHLDKLKVSVGFELVILRIIREVKVVCYSRRNPQPIVAFYCRYYYSLYTVTNLSLLKQDPKHNNNNNNNNNKR